MSSCWPAIFGAEKFLLYFNGSNLYLLNFKPTLKSNYTSYAGATFLNGRWYVELEYYPPTCLTQVGRFYRLNKENFCIEPVTVPGSTFRGEN